MAEEIPADNPPDASPEEVPYAKVWPITPPPLPSMNPAGHGVPPSEEPPVGSHVRPTKPGIVTAIGVTSIIVASVSFIAVGVMTLQALGSFVVLRASQIGIRMSQMAAATQEVGSAATQPTAPRGLPMEDRQTAINILSGMEELSVARQAQLDSMLAEAGQDILGIEAGQLTSRDVRAAVREHLRGRPVVAGVPGEAIFMTVSGRVELHDTHGVFRPTDGSKAIHASADVATYEASLQPHDATVSNLPTLPGATPASTGTATVNLNLNQGGAQTLVFLEAAGSAILAIYLLIAEILTVRGSTWGGPLHWVYVPLKLGTVAMLFVGWSRFDRNFTAAWAALRPSASTTTFSTEVFVMTFAAALYPILLTIALLTPTARGFFGKRGA